MSTITFRPLTQNTDADWGYVWNWLPLVVPNGPDVDVVVPTIYHNSVALGYHIKIGDSYSIRNLSLAAPNDLEIFSALSVSDDFYANGQILMLAGALSAGSLEANGSLSGFGTVTVSGAMTAKFLYGVRNILTVNAGSLALADDMSVLSGSLNINVAAGGFANFNNGELKGGVYEPGGFFTLNVGGVLTTLDATMILGSDSSVSFKDPSTGAFEDIQTTLQTIAPGGVLDFEPGGQTLQVSAQFGALDVAGQILLDGIVSFSATSLHIEDGGLLTAANRNDDNTSITLNFPIVNDGVIAVEAEPGIQINDDLFGFPTHLIISQTVTGAGYFEFVLPPNSSFAGISPTLELQGAQSENVVFDPGGSGELVLDNPRLFTGQIATLAPPGTNGFVIDLPSVSYDDFIGDSYSGGSHSGTLFIDTTKGDYALHFLGAFEASDFRFFDVNGSLLVGVDPHLASGPVVFGNTPRQTYIGQTTTAPFSDIKILGLDALAATIQLYPPQAGVLSLPDASSYGVTNVNFDAAKGKFTMDGDAAALTAAMRALVFTPSFDHVAPGFTRDVKLTLTVANSAASTTMQTDVRDVNGATIAAALSGHGQGFATIVDSAADLMALTPQQISQLAGLGVTRLASNDASVVFNAAQSDAIVAAHMTLGAPANDYALEHFDTKSVRYRFDGDGFLAWRVTTSGAQIDTLVFHPGAIAGEAYKSYDVRSVGGQRQSVFFYGAGGALVATETFPAAGVVEYQFAGPRELFQFSADAHDVTLHFAAGFGTATVNGFNTPNAATDVLDISSLFPNFAAAQAAMTQASGTVIKDSLGDLLRIAGVAPSQLTSAQLGFG